MGLNLPRSGLVQHRIDRGFARSIQAVRPQRRAIDYNTVYKTEALLLRSYAIRQEFQRYL
jgi:hypothetical protein